MDFSKDGPKTILYNVISALIVAAIIALISYIGNIIFNKGYNAGYNSGLNDARTKYTQQIIGAPQAYVNELEKLISAANQDRSTDIITSAAAIVSARDAMRCSLSSLSSFLNSDIDVLKEKLEEYRQIEERYKGNIPLDIRDRLGTGIRRAVALLASKWPTQKIIVERESRKVLTDFGLTQVNP